MIKRVIAVLLSSSTLLFGLLPGLFGNYKVDDLDTDEAYYARLAEAVDEDALSKSLVAPQTIIYNIVNSHFFAALPEGKTVKKAIIIGYDGCRADALAFREKGASGIDELLDNNGSLVYTYCGGAPYPATNTQDTSTAPGWCSILTGKWGSVTGVTANGIVKSNDNLTLLTQLVESGTIKSSAFVTSWSGHFKTDDSTYKLEKEYCESKNLNVSFKLCTSDTGTSSAMLKSVKSKGCPDLLFGIIESTDHSGHSFGFSTNNPVYQLGFKAEDGVAYDIIKAIKARSTYETEDWLIIITSDHGGVGTGHGGASLQERQTFLATNLTLTVAY